MVAAFSKLQRFPRNRLVDEDLARARVGELDLLMRFGDPTTQTSAGDNDPVFFWDIEWSCGLIVALQFKQVTEVLTIRLDEPDIDHALRHLSFELRDLWRLDEESPDRFHERFGAVDRSFQVWCDGADGQEQVAYGLTDRDAECLAREAGARAQGERYCVLRTA